MKLNRSIAAILCLLLGTISLRLWIGNAQGPSTTIAIDAAALRHPINPNIYGVAFATTAQLTDLNSPLNRSGGNATSQYNWQCNCDNRGSDWYFESLDDGSSTAGKANDDFIADSKAAGAQAMLTIPTIGWVAKLGPNRGKLSSFSIAKYGPQKANDWQWFPDAGNGVRSSDNQFVTGNDPNDANIPADSQFQSGWMQHLVGKWSAASNGGLRYYLMDNEPSLWQETHRDVHPTGPTMNEIKNDIIDYGAKVKAMDPSALVVGPEEWGWPGYFYSGFDQQWAGQHNNWNPAAFPDRTAHSGADYLPWVLDQLHQHDVQTGQRSLDVFTVHWYPQGSQALNLPGEAFSNDVSSQMSQLRNRSTRSLWDPNYTDESWINRKAYVIARIRGWVNQYYPGLQTGITEYNWGAEGYINGATAQADVYGIFGREGLDMATRWTTPSASTPTYKAMKMYRNYDGNKSTFGDISVSDNVPDPDTLASFAAIRSSDGALTVMIINKSLSNSTLANVSLSNFSGSGLAQAWQLTSANAITRLSDINFGGSNLNLTVPAQSITLLVIAAAVPTPTPTPTSTPSPSPTASPAAPVLYTEQNSQRALALDSVNLVRDPFAVTNAQNFDHRTRIILLAGNIVLNPGEDSSVVTAQAQDSQGYPYPLTVEFVGKVPGYDWLSEVVVRFPDQMTYTGDFWVSISLRGVPSNKAFVTIKP